MKKNDLPVVLLIMASGLLLTYAAGWATRTNPGSETLFFTVYYIRCTLMVLLGWILAKKFNFLSQGGFRNYRKKNSWMLAIPIIFPGLAFSKQLFEGCDLDTVHLMLVLLYIFSCSIFEEVMFRGALHGYLRKQNPDISHFKISIIVAAFFALAHLINLSRTSYGSVGIQLIYAFYTGLLFSALMIRTGNIWLLGIVHGVLNIITSGCSILSKEPSLTNNMGTNELATMGWVALFFSPLLFLSWILLYNVPRRKYSDSLYIEKP